MVAHHHVTLRKTTVEELAAICAMEQGEAREFIIPYPLERHLKEFQAGTTLYRSIWRSDRLVGFVILALDPDGRSVEFRRIVVSERGRGIGSHVVRLVQDLCRRELGRERIWLDVFETNTRARHVYEKCGYRRFGTSRYEDRKLLLYETTV